MYSLDPSLSTLHINFYYSISFSSFKPVMKIPHELLSLSLNVKYFCIRAVNAQQTSGSTYKTEAWVANCWKLRRKMLINVRLLTEQASVDLTPKTILDNLKEDVCSRKYKMARLNWTKSLSTSVETFMRCLLVRYASRKILLDNDVPKMMDV